MVQGVDKHLNLSRSCKRGLEDIPQRELDHARRHRSFSYSTKAGAADDRAWEIKLGMIEGIEHLSAQLYGCALSESAYLCFLGYRNIKVGLMRAPEGCSAQVSVSRAIANLGKWACRIGSVYRSRIEISVEAVLDVTRGGYLLQGVSGTQLASRGTGKAEYRTALGIRNG